MSNAIERDERRGRAGRRRVLLRFPDFSHASIPTVIRALQKFVEPAQGSARDR